MNLFKTYKVKDNCQKSDIVLVHQRLAKKKTKKSIFQTNI